MDTAIVYIYMESTVYINVSINFTYGCCLFILDLL